MTSPLVCAAAPSGGRRVWIQWTLSDRGHLSIVSFAGEIDARNAADLSGSLRAVMDAGSSQLVADLTDVDFLGAVGSTALLTAERDAARRHLRLDVVCAATSAGKVRALAEVGEAVALHATVDDALCAQAGSVGPVANAGA